MHYDVFPVEMGQLLKILQFSDIVQSGIYLCIKIVSKSYESPIWEFTHASARIKEETSLTEIVKYYKTFLIIEVNISYFKAIKIMHHPAFPVQIGQLLKMNLWRY